jgi:hypothetical protein
MGLEIVDVVHGKRIATRPIDQGATVLVRGGRVFVFGGGGTLDVVDRDGKLVAAAAPPPCKWEWWKEALAGVRLDMTGDEVARVLGAPRARTKPDEAGIATWTYADVALTMQTYGDADPCGGGPARAPTVKAIDARGAAARTASGVHVGSSEADLDKAYGGHAIAARWTDARRVFGNAGDAGDTGWTITVDRGAVTAIHVED